MFEAILNSSEILSFIGLLPFMFFLGIFDGGIGSSKSTKKVKSNITTTSTDIQKDIGQGSEIGGDQSLAFQVEGGLSDVQLMQTDHKAVSEALITNRLNFENLTDTFEKMIDTVDDTIGSVQSGAKNMVDEVGKAYALSSGSNSNLDTTKLMYVVGGVTGLFLVMTYLQRR